MPHPKVKISDDSGNTVSVTNNRLAVETEGGGYTTWVTYGNLAVGTNAVQLSTVADITDAKEILLQASDENGGFIMVGSADTVNAESTVADRIGLRLDSGETLILALSSFSSVWLEGNSGTQYVNVAYFK